MTSEHATEFFWQNIDDIRATLTGCDKCDGEGKHVCPNCLNMITPFCPNCLDDIADGQGNCPKCHALRVCGCDSCNHTGYVKCQECKGEGYAIEGFELDGKRAKTIDELFREFTPKVMR